MRDKHVQIVKASRGSAEEAIDMFLGSESIVELRAAMERASQALPQNMHLTFRCTFEVFDEKRERVVKLIDSAVTADGDTSRFCRDRLPLQRYLVRGEIFQAPEDHCPSCWAGWSFEKPDQTCRACGLQLGRDIKLLIDSDQCPYCAAGRVSIDQPACPQCGHELDLAIVAWG